MSWLARLKDADSSEISDPTKTTEPTKRVFVGFVGTPPDRIRFSMPEKAAPDSDPTKTTERVSVVSVGTPPDHIQNFDAADIYTARLALFTDRGLNLVTATALADRLALRDCQRDDRRVCLECAHISGATASRRCSQWRQAGLGSQEVPRELPILLQRCKGFGATHHTNPVNIARPATRLEGATQ